MVGGLAIVAAEVLRERDPRGALRHLLPVGLAVAVYGALRSNALHGAPAVSAVHFPGSRRCRPSGPMPG